MRTATANETPTCPCCGNEIAGPDLLVDQSTGIVTYNGVSERFTPNQLRLIKALLEAYPAVMTKEQCLSALASSTNPDAWPEIKIVDVVVCHIRKRCDRLGFAITTVWGTGYRLELSSAVASEVLRNKRFEETRKVRTAVDPGDISAVRMLRAQGYPLTDIARRLRLTFKAVTAAVDHIAIEDSRARDMTRAA